jgi:hypothetical protein
MVMYIIICIKYYDGIYAVGGAVAQGGTKLKRAAIRGAPGCKE